jgi:signal transduction histidine kinase
MAGDLRRPRRKRRARAPARALLAGAIHEARNPLFAITAALDAFEARFGTRGDHERYLSLLRAEAARLGDLLRDLAEYSRPRPLAPAEATLGAAAAAAAELQAPLARRLGVDLTNNVPRGFGPARLDLERAPKAIARLIGAALQSAPPGSEVVLEPVEEGEGGRLWRGVAVVDAGPPPSAVELAALFEPFAARRRGATGLSLALARRDAEAHGGRAEARLRDRGLEAALLLPVAAPEAPP